MNHQPLTLDVLELTLKELGWEAHQGFNPKLKIWCPTEHAKLETTTGNATTVKIFVPQDETAPDFEYLLQDTVTEFVDLSAVNVIEELAISRLRIKKNLDKFVVSTDGSSVENGVVGWRIGANLVNGLSEILMSGARAAHQYRRWYSGTSKVIADNYLDSCLMGQTEVGSYVVKAFVPANDKVSVSNSKKKKTQSQISTREVSEIVLSSVEATKEVLTEFTNERNPEAFEWAMTQGVSVEMLSGIRSLINTNETEISVEFISLASDVTKHELRRSTIVFDPTLREAVEVGVSTLKEQPKPTDLVVAGEVIGLMRQFDEPDSRRIKMRGHSTVGKTRVYTVHLEQDDYEKALEAHRKQVLFRVSGIADKGRFTEVKSVHVTDEPVSSERNEHSLESRSGLSGQLDLLDGVSFGK